MVNPKAQSFKPIAAPDARILILGTMPGRLSLQQQEYYAHPRNLFWRFIGDVTGAAQDRPYEERVAALLEKKIALWDVFESCVRPGSLDSQIQQEEMNDLGRFLKTHPQIKTIFTNGARAEKALKDYIKQHPSGERLDQKFNIIRLPSTSPANAGIPYEIKRKAWSNILPKP